MADWMHREATWAWAHTEDEWGNRKYTLEMPEFTDWLDEQCKGGWEVFKISRDFRDSRGKTTWCIFRKKTE
jgi:hypothetical protein